MRGFGVRTRLRSMADFIRRKRKIGIALGSGGAKGLAHLGALQAFEENGIRFDVLAGTSAGSIAGSLYAKGYSPAEMTDQSQCIGCAFCATMCPDCIITVEK